MNLRNILILIGLTLLVALPGQMRIPAIDRDEARYAQATVQMLETGDFVDIRFQDEPRWKKPVGAYWAQAASVAALGGPEDRQIWKHRVPSIIGALIAVLATYFTGLTLFGQRPAFAGAALFSVTLALTYEAHAAKTDALLVACTTLMLLALARLRTGKGARGTSLLFWGALGAGVLIKGPIALALAIFTLAALALWERRIAWMKPLLFWAGPLLMLAIVLPWFYLIWDKTDGAFFRTAIGEDLAPKLQGGQEKHGAPPGYHFVALLLMFFPAILFLPAAISLAVRSLRGKIEMDANWKTHIRLLLCWIVPFFILLELTPTKLPHYALPVYPALALLCGLAAERLLKAKDFPVSLRIGGVLGFFMALLLAAIGVFALTQYRHSGAGVITYLGGGILALLAILILWAAFTRRYTALPYSIAAGAFAMIFAFGWVLPNLDKLLVSRNIVTALNAVDIDTPVASTTPVLSPSFTEPSLVFGLGTDILLAEPARSQAQSAQPGAIIIMDIHEFESLPNGQCHDVIDIVSGENYAKGDPVELVIAIAGRC